MDQRTLSILEYPKILEKVAAQAGFSLGKQRALSLRPSTHLAEAKDRQNVTHQARRLIELKPGITVGGARDVRDLARRAGLGGRLEPADLLEVRGTLEASRVLRRTILPLREHVQTIADIASGLPDLPEIEAEISRCLDGSGQVLDSASATLRRIRIDLKTSHARLMEKLNGILTSSAYADVIQDPIITVRDGRYVIPIKSEARSRFRSIVHDQSASGATLFVEPLLTVELNNQWRELQLAETREVVRILEALSNLVGSSSEAIVRGVECIADIDFALACARYAASEQASEPRLVEGSGRDSGAEIRLIDARHPLIGPRVVPISIHVGGEVGALVITGPNTGGKTVALKTVGLITLMALSGLQIPCAEGSTVRVVDGVYADIGDEQSIEQSLSTFSSHMTQIIAILGRATARSLVLLDELGAGTDPAEGSVLARAILDHLLSRGSVVVATSHYTELKEYAHTTPGVANASVEFDVETLSPTYRLTIGLPGRSNALAIAARLGLPEPILAAARDLLSEDDVRVEGLLAEIQRERERAESARRASEREHRRVTDLARQLSARLAALEREKQSALAAAHAAAEAELADVRTRLRDMAGRIERGEARRNDLAPLLREVKLAEGELAQRRPPRPVTDPAEGADARVRVGSWVLVKRLGQSGKVVSISGAFAEVQVGSFKTRVRLDDLDPISRAEAERAAPLEPVGSLVSLPRASGPVPSSQIEIRGWRAEEVGPELDRYLNEAYMAGLPLVRIVHGKGTGALRQVVREHLASHPLVRSFDFAERRDGGDGVTVAALAN